METFFAQALRRPARETAPSAQVGEPPAHLGEPFAHQGGLFAYLGEPFALVTSPFAQQGELSADLPLKGRGPTRHGPGRAP